MALMASGYWVLIIIFSLFFLISGIFMFCYCYGDHGGRYFGSNENITAVVYTKVPLAKKKCRCSNKFKGICKDCEAPEFVNDGKDGILKDFSDFGGDEGFDRNGPNGKADPIRGFLGNGTQTHTQVQETRNAAADGHGAGEQSASPAGYSNYDGSSY